MTNDDNDPNQGPALATAIHDVWKAIAAHRHNLQPNAADQLADAATALLLMVNLHVNSDGRHPNRVRVTLHGLDIYVDRQDSTRLVEFGRDEMPGRLLVDTELADD